MATNAAKHRVCTGPSPRLFPRATETSPSGDAYAMAKAFQHSTSPDLAVEVLTAHDRYIYNNLQALLLSGIVQSQGHSIDWYRSRVVTTATSSQRVEMFPRDLYFLLEEAKIVLVTAGKPLPEATSNFLQAQGYRILTREVPFFDGGNLLQFGNTILCGQQPGGGYLEQSKTTKALTKALAARLQRCTVPAVNALGVIPISLNAELCAAYEGYKQLRAKHGPEAMKTGIAEIVPPSVMAVSNYYYHLDGFITYLEHSHTLLVLNSEMLAADSWAKLQAAATEADIRVLDLGHEEYIEKPVFLNALELYDGTTSTLVMPALPPKLNKQLTDYGYRLITATELLRDKALQASVCTSLNTDERRIAIKDFKLECQHQFDMPWTDLLLQLDVLVHTPDNEAATIDLLEHTDEGRNFWNFVSTCLPNHTLAQRTDFLNTLSEGDDLLSCLESDVMEIASKDEDTQQLYIDGKRGTFAKQSRARIHKLLINLCTEFNKTHDDKLAIGSTGLDDDTTAFNIQITRTTKVELLPKRAFGLKPYDPLIVGFGGPHCCAVKLGPSGSTPAPASRESEEAKSGAGAGAGAGAASTATLKR